MKKLNYILLGALLMLTSCDKPYDTHVEYTNVVAVYYHEGNSYSIATKTDHTISMTYLAADYDSQIDIFDDVLNTNSMYVVGNEHFNNGGVMDNSTWQIHIHSIDDINGAGWNHGKSGHGMTLRIQ